MTDTTPALGPIEGIHHVTAIASDPQRNVDFYTGVLGLRLVKRTVNFDDPGTYHLYYGDGLGRPGTILTFFPWPGAPRGRQGNGQLTEIAFAVPADALPYWTERLARHGVAYEPAVERMGERVLAFADEDGLRLELVASDRGVARRAPWRAGPVPPEHAIRGFHGITLSEEGYERTAALLRDVMGFDEGGSDNNRGSRFRYHVGADDSRATVDVVCLPAGRDGQLAAGTVHHVAWRVADEAEQLAWRARLADLGYDVTPVMDRQYFHSIYYREPGGVIFEIATDPPGFTRDETPEALGTHLKLPPWLEPRRALIESVLPPLDVPKTRP